MSTQYRKEIELVGEERYTWVTLGGIPDLPDWHEQSQPWRYPFPTPEAAELFAYTSSDAHPRRAVIVEYPNGNRLELGER